jgi:hypothetical protein
MALANTSLFRYGNNHSHKKFYSPGPGGLELVPAVSIVIKQQEQQLQPVPNIIPITKKDRYHNMQASAEVRSVPVALWS